MKRFIFRAQVKDEMEEKAKAVLQEENKPKTFIAEGKLMTAAAFSWEKNIFLYYESIEAEIKPEELLCNIEAYLVDWPGQKENRKWIPMIDVFHFNEPLNAEHWKRKEPVESRKGRVAHLKPEMMASYIYYHYQLQEEHAFHGPKYEIIAMHENLLFGYQEFPAVVEEPIVPKKLNTNGTPANWNDSRMDLHFQAWEDGHLYFKHIDQIFAYYME
ncbi:hypothetical protein acsn021_07600 [Anaerocolumna cellulosilytica]|uniref:Uncharacterized protein n=1 Tax=Anaerocolumna cellulosilytica TaxID=433286 RepID=A0A6S6R1V9_9FIRM|nr:hypothetical protein [Anaerocolumna cellulosilytica]MBB5197880.1 hypothetical protein [Anaerocolumna cellulosilytica]BCJ93191.1 hypothetical protein acsn021_07600 [Anaerocolumna cellulosilytica]